ncbi:proton-coupled zinc antiporter SLC30A2-like isoform X2 [Sitodiplosis mosellana]|uniref:proton-coupled zinc antiporter SLC30A2-like isoform X2 n=1 Tax=Sitodiplosis mosellana TaxID=263140 RepID=UPI0024449CD4|nr:proton-coupled zinc antiporter SLC30A2-like isoform X2 [Sitodiplosis mosellana]
MNWNLRTRKKGHSVSYSSLFKDDSPCLLATNPSKGTSHRNDAQNKKEKRQLIIATTLCFFFMFAEILGGYLAGSLAIMSDAAHLLSDCISFIVALLAIVWAKKTPTNYMTFGYKRVEVLGAILSIFGIWLLTTFLFYFAVNRLMYQDFDIDADTMMIVSAVGIVINIIMALILHGEGLCCFKQVRHHHHHNCHSHSPKHNQTYHNNNKTKFEYRPLIDEATEKRGANLWSSIPVSISSSKRVDRRDRICSSRSPNHSRSNSLSRSYAFTNGHCSGSDMIRRSSHTMSSVSSTAGTKIKDIIDVQSNDCIDVDLTDEKLPVNCSNETIGVGGCVSNGSAICPIHHYVHRDSSEHTPITSSDSEDLHDHRSNHRNGFVNHLHCNQSRHSHDFSSKNINIQAAVIHVIGDFIQSIGVFISAVIIKNYPNAKIADPLCTFVFSIIVMMTTCTIMKESIAIILEAVPNSVSTERLKDDLKSIDGVRSVHSLNVWCLTVGWHVLSVHIIIDPFVKSSDVLYIATTIAQKGYNIKQCTIQIEKYDREIECDEAVGITNQKSIVSENENSIINILA